jgi:ABC-type multidrug transport system ATPase subunit/Zn-dependent protease
VTTVDLLRMRPAVRRDVLVGPALMRGPVPVHLVKDPVSGARLEVGAKEHFLIVRLDGTRTLEEIGAQYAAEFGVRLGAAQWQQMLRLLSVRQLLAGAAQAGPAGPAAQAGPAGRPADGAGRPGGGWFSGRTRMVADAPALMDRLHDATAFARRPAVLGPLLALCAALLVAEGLWFGELAHATRRLFDEPVTLCAVGVVLWFSLAAHELAHGLVARAYGLRVTEIGLRRYAGFMTYLYCEVEDVQFLGHRGRQIAVAAAGAAMNLVFLLPFWPVWALLPGSAQAVPFFGGLLLLGTATALLNLVPLPPLDGYKALGYALGTLRLATESQVFLRAAPRRAARAAYPPRLRAVYGGYAALCALLAAAALAALGLLCREQLPSSWSAVTPWLPLAAAAAALLLRLLGTRFGAARAARVAAASAAASSGPAPQGERAAPADTASPATRDASAAALTPTGAGGPAGLASPLSAVARTRVAASVEDAGGVLPAPTPLAASRVGAAPAEAPGEADSAPRAAASAPTSSPTAGPAGSSPPTAGNAGPVPRSRPHTAPEALMKNGGQGSQETAVVLDGVSKRYGEVRALDGVSLTVGRGEFFGVLGPNGAGKTTLVEIVEGMRQADSGTVTVFGESPWPRNIGLLRRMGVQTQTSAFFTRLTAWEHLETVAALHGLDRTAAHRSLEAVGLGDKARSRVDDLSGGQRQRLALATALVHDPDLIFLDEPTAALDPEARRSLWDVLRALRGQGRTIVYTTHYLDEAEALCDRVAIIAGGRLAALDTPTALIRSLAAPARLLVPADRITPDQARAIDGVDRVLVEGGEVVIETHSANRVLVAVGEYVDMDAIQTRTATLEDAYLRLTGSEHAR